MENAKSIDRQGWLDSLRIYADRRVIAILFLGFSSGLPILLVAGTLSAWLSEEGVSKSTIGLFSFVWTPYALKFIWAPLVDRMPIPFLTSALGRRRSWMLLSQMALLASIYLLSQTQPGTDLYWTALFAVCLTFSSATQDIAIDAFRIDSLPEEQLGAGAAVVVLGYRIGMWVATAGALFLAGTYDWSWAYTVMAILMAVGIITTLLVREPEGSTTALVDEATRETDSQLLAVASHELTPWRGAGGLLVLLAAVLLALQPLSFVFGFASGMHGDVGFGGLLVAAVRLALVLWGAWLGWHLLSRSAWAPGEIKDYVMVALLWLIAEIAAYGIPGTSVWFGEIYAWALLSAVWALSNTVTQFFGHAIAYDTVVAPVWLFVTGLWLRFFFFVFLYGFFYFSKRAIANFGMVAAERENSIHLWTRRAIVEPYYDFSRRYGVGIAMAILVLVSVFKAPDAVLTLMANPFYLEVGFTTIQIAWVSKTFGLWMTILGGLAGGLFVHRFGILKSMTFAVIVMAGSNLMFALMAHFGTDALAITQTALAQGVELSEAQKLERETIGAGLMPLFYLLIIIENLSGGLGTAIFVAYLSSLCNRSFSAVQYAMLTSFMQMFAKFIVVPSSGFYAESFGWLWFFLTSTLFAIPALILLWFLSLRLEKSHPAAAQLR